ncbi:MAG: AarF/ABC1/UbiB kinase family protein [Limnospira sp. PMC 1291.21]|uniref:ABC1 kinase family protein n=1 Tax=Limnospira TaxID=2596745 RepID=UPI0002804010|nr:MULTISPECIES: AarF/ABC1/UbiB kinase family protein [Limnospira]EKD06121.1 ABC-1 domain protein [Arthrospira platensis C1]MDT9181426.1 AarF/ABC1/UbiB kinase family protein [Limnospira sp. PMC 289.06]MDY7054643.1 AarF/ABC1/UbiB kinase family protein [Limnospira fusiformis LS22]MDT9176404.1 AarF/ABC1/UbiB kinase family protein [Limnospira sp. PMC 1238.20]MDT9192215.1 AarF/ABC1/UbiB kinase family protein [Limnospira sp. PMC 1245.20]
MFSITKKSSRKREILEIVFSNGWDYMRGLLVGDKPEEPRLPSPDVLRNILIELGPVYVKLGQLLSTRPDLLPGRYVDALTDLQANVPAVAWGDIETQLRQQFSQPLDQIFSRIETEAVAAASIGQIHRATLKSGEEVALKVQRPGIAIIVEQDIELIKSLADLVAITEWGEDYDIVAIAEEFTSALKAELDFTSEAEYTDKLRQNLSKTRWFDPEKLIIPKVYWEFTTPNLLVLEWLDGVPLLLSEPSKKQTNEDDPRRGEITSLLFRAFFQQIYLDGFFHADPHPGNLFYLNDGRVAILDCGMVGRLDPRTQQILTEMLLAVVDIDARRCAQLTLELAESSESVQLGRLTNDYDSMLRRYYNLSLAEINFSQVFYEILQISRNNRIRLPSNMGLYAKTLANLEGVTRSFNPEVNLLNEIKPLMTELFRNQLLGDNPLETLLRTALDLKSLSLRSPSQIELFLDRVTSETLKWNIRIPELTSLKNSLNDAANRLSFSIVLGSLIMGAAMISTGAQTPQLSLISNILFAAASLVGLWLLVSVLRSGNLR